MAGVQEGSTGRDGKGRMELVGPSRIVSSRLPMPVSNLARSALVVRGAAVEDPSYPHSVGTFVVIDLTTGSGREVAAQREINITKLCRVNLFLPR